MCSRRVLRVAKRTKLPLGLAYLSPGYDGSARRDVTLTKWAPRRLATAIPFGMRGATGAPRKIASRPDFHLREFPADRKSELTVESTPWTFCTICRGLKLTQKKTWIATERERKDVAEKRGPWKRGSQRVDPNRRVFLDKT